LVFDCLHKDQWYVLWFRTAMQSVKFLILKVKSVRTLYCIHKCFIEK